MQDQNISLTPEQIALVQSSFDQVVPIRATVGALFYRRLFALDPSLRGLFTHDMRIQIAKLMAMLEWIVENLNRFEVLQPQVRALGHAHVGYGAQDAHYDTVELALLWALRQSLEEQFTAAAEAAWRSAYALIATTMREGAHGSFSAHP
jgi:hemoglobin-like flavoprotein